MSSNHVSTAANAVRYPQRNFLNRLWDIVSSDAGSLPLKLGQETTQIRSVFQSLAQNKDPSIAQSARNLWSRFDDTDTSQTPEPQTPSTGRGDRSAQVDEYGWEIVPEWLMQKEGEEDYGEGPSSGY